MIIVIIVDIHKLISDLLNVQNTSTIIVIDHSSRTSPTLCLSLPSYHHFVLTIRCNDHNYVYYVHIWYSRWTNHKKSPMVAGSDLLWLYPLYYLMSMIHRRQSLSCWCWIPFIIFHKPDMLGESEIYPYWLVVYLLLWKIWVRQLGWWHSQYMEK